MESPTLTEGQNDQALQLDFLNHQREHDCTDCGRAYLTAEIPSEGPGYYRQIVGGGSIVAGTNGPIREVHILPHCGTELPDDLLSELDQDMFGSLARLVHDNADIGTGAIYRRLSEQVMAGNGDGMAVVGFHMSRLLLDANRAQPIYQLPAQPYVGTAELYADYQLRNGRRLLEESLLPWITAVNKLLAQLGDAGVVYHHHTMDIYSMTPRPWDQAAFAKRPAFQLVWERAIHPEYAGEPIEQDRGLASRDDLVAVRDQITEYLYAKVGLDDAAGEIDYPLLSPVIPFVGASKGDGEAVPAHVMYDLRKDILATNDLIRTWVTDGPWRMPSSTMSYYESVFVS